LREKGPWIQPTSVASERYFRGFRNGLCSALPRRHVGCKPSRAEPLLGRGGRGRGTESTVLEGGVATLWGCWIACSAPSSDVGQCMGCGCVVDSQWIGSDPSEDFGLLTALAAFRSPCSTARCIAPNNPREDNQVAAAITLQRSARRRAPAVPDLTLTAAIPTQLAGAGSFGTIEPGYSCCGCGAMILLFFFSCFVSRFVSLSEFSGDGAKADWIALGRPRNEVLAANSRTI